VLFAAGEAGAWYDPSDTTTLFQDSAGTTPVTAVEQPVGLILDKSKGLVLGADVVLNGDFEAGASNWAIVGANVSIAGGKASWTAAAANERITQGSLTSTKWYQVSFDVADYTAGNVYFASAVAVASVTGTGAYSYLITGATNIYIRSGPSGFTGSVDNISVRELPGNHAFNPNATTVRPVLKADGALRYLEFGGVDDWLQTASIDFSGTDKLSVFAGVYKTSDAATAVFAELSSNLNNNNGAFTLSAPSGAGLNTYGWVSKGTDPGILAPTGYVAPVKSVLTGLGDISGDSSILRSNGAIAASSATDQGTGNFGNYALYIGRRGGSSLPFNGRLYSMVVLGRTATADEIAQAETYVAAKTGVTL
jgi:hypothetical protein